MPPRIPLPSVLLSGTFSTEDARRAGIGQGRLRGRDISHPFRGLHASGPVGDDLVSYCEALVPLLGENRWFSHVTAARLWGMPLPTAWTSGEPLHTLAVAGAHRIERTEVVGWETERADVPRSVLGLLPVISPAAVWAQLSVPGAIRASTPQSEGARGRWPLSPQWLVAVGDFLLSGTRAATRVPLCSIDDLHAELRAHRGKRGAKALAWAIERLRRPVDSPRETFLRLGLVERGLPEPTVQVAVKTAAGVRHADLGYPDSRVLLEYHGDHHRTDRRQWREDLTRRQLFEDAGYTVIEVAYDDVHPDCAALAERVRRVLRRADRST
ncbi:hypothetical protein [Microbacterium rhizomatis]|uniref:DUF559 domain-containing protein n=1 Tax=Microbacterium rhizomatis TaxID=1631477 RepID=A0A5J5J4D7_9MICO|nr:hypothetical protein [Microbacterium rhizomatis]KAA9110936.1 hypothetical protein F6B43_04710 [Microbacterium rhizomatis]